MEYVKRLLLVLHWLVLAASVCAGVLAISGVFAWLIYGPGMYEMLYGMRIYEYESAYAHAADSYWGVAVIPLLISLAWLTVLIALRFITEGKVRILPWRA